MQRRLFVLALVAAAVLVLHFFEDPQHLMLRLLMQLFRQLLFHARPPVNLQKVIELNLLLQIFDFGICLELFQQMLLVLLLILIKRQTFREVKILVLRHDPPERVLIRHGLHRALFAEGFEVGVD